jgi:hypothetical protein
LALALPLVLVFEMDVACGEVVPVFALDAAVTLLFLLPPAPAFHWIDMRRWGRMLGASAASPALAAAATGAEVATEAEAAAGAREWDRTVTGLCLGRVDGSVDFMAVLPASPTPAPE